MHKHLRDWISWLIQYIHYLQMIYSKWTEDTTTAFFLTLCLTWHAIWPPVISVIAQNHTSDTRGNTKIISIKNNTAFSKKVKCAVATSASLFPRNLALILKKNGWRFYKSFFFKGPLMRPSGTESWINLTIRRNYCLHNLISFIHMPDDSFALLS